MDSRLSIISYACSILFKSSKGGGHGKTLTRVLRKAVSSTSNLRTRVVLLNKGRVDGHLDGVVKWFVGRNLHNTHLSYYLEQ